MARFIPAGALFFFKRTSRGAWRRMAAVRASSVRMGPKCQSWAGSPCSFSSDSNKISMIGFIPFPFLVFNLIIKESMDIHIKLITVV